MTSTLALCLGSLAAAYAFLSALFHFTQDAKEPPAVETSIPFISPLLGLIPGMQDFFVKQRSDVYPQSNSTITDVLCRAYHQKLTASRNKHGLPIYTLRMPGQRMYIVNSVSLIPTLQRQIKTIAFAPIEAQAAATVMGVGPAGNAIIGSDQMLEDGSYLSTFVPSIQPAMAPGPGLDAINSAAVRYISDSLEALAAKGPASVELFSWVRTELFMATTESIYGPKNPFRDPVLEKAW